MQLQERRSRREKGSKTIFITTNINIFAATTIWQCRLIHSNRFREISPNLFGNDFKPTALILLNKSTIHRIDAAPLDGLKVNMICREKKYLLTLPLQKYEIIKESTI